MNSARNGRATMNAKPLILAAVVTVWASAAVAAIQYGHPEPANTVQARAAATPRVVVTASKFAAEVPRIVVVARRTDGRQILASNQR
jgi:hypothetical protein